MQGTSTLARISRLMLRIRVRPTSGRRSNLLSPYGQPLAGLLKASTLVVALSNCASLPPPIAYHPDGTITFVGSHYDLTTQITNGGMCAAK